jgi:putative ABC transport system permease protein
VNDLRFALRIAARHPAFTLLAVLTLALGIGANTAVFTLLDAVLLRPRGYPYPDRLAFVWQTLPRQGVMDLEATPADFRVWRDEQHETFSSLALIATDSFALTGDGDPERVRGARLSASTFPTLGVEPAFGRAFTESEDVAGNGFVVVLSDGLWRRRYASRTDILGRSIDLDGRSYLVVGVMPPSFHLPEPLAASDQLWVPMALTPANNRISHNFTVLARLRPNVSVAAANATMAAWAARAAASDPGHKGLGARVVAVHEQAVKNVRATLLMLLGAVGLVLLIACSNVANLFLARVAGRQRELAVRAAMGATRIQLAALLTCESLLVALAGGVVGLLVGSWALQALWATVGATLPFDTPARLSGTVTAFTMAAALVAGILCGAISSMQALRGAAREIGSLGDRTGGTGPARRPVRRSWSVRLPSRRCSWRPQVC